MLNVVKSLLLASGDSPLPDWVTTLFPILQQIFVWGLAVGALIMIVLVLLQQSNSQGGAGSAITGVADTYYSQNKGKSKEGRLKLATTITAIVMGVMAILYFVSLIVVSA